MKKAISVILTFIMVLSLFAVSSFAEGDMPDTTTTATAKEGQSPIMSITGLPTLDRTNWTVTVSTTRPRCAERLLDGDDKSFWHSNYIDEGGVIIARDEAPYTLEFTFPEASDLSGFILIPRPDGTTGKIISLYFEASDTEYGEFERITEDITLGAHNKEIILPSNIKARRIKMTILEGDKGYGTLAEFYAISADSKKDVASYIEVLKGEVTLPVDKTVTGKAADNQTPVNALNGLSSVDRTGWIVKVDSARPNTAERMLDGDKSTYWHSNFETANEAVVSADEAPFTLEFILPEATEISGFIMFPRTDLNIGRIASAYFEVAESDTSEYFRITDEISFETSANQQEVVFASNIKVKKIKMTITNGSGGKGTLAEFYAIEKSDDYNTVSFEEFLENEKKNKLYVVDKSSVKVECDYPIWSTNNIAKVTDGLTTSIWQTVSFDEPYAPPILVDFGKVQKIVRMDYTPRQTEDYDGFWYTYDVFGSIDGETWFDVKTNVNNEKSLLTHSLIFDEEISVRYLEINVTKFHNRRVSCAELTFYQTREAYEASGVGAFGNYELTIGEKSISIEKSGNITEKEIDVAPFIVGGTTLIPLRGLLEEMGAEISWDGEKSEVTIKAQNKEIRLQIWNKRVYVKDNRYGNIMYTLLTYPVIKDSRTFIPLRFVSEQLGYNVEWIGETQTIKISAPEE